MKTIKKLSGLVLSLVLIASLVVPTVAYATGPDRREKPDKERPVRAANIRLVKKITIRDPGPPFVPPGQEKKKNKEGAATGILGQVPPSDAEDKYAIIIGISDYPGIANDLWYADDDAIEMYQALTTLYEYDPANIRLLIDFGGTFVGGLFESASFDNILEAVEWVKGEAILDDEVVFFFSGHGGWVLDPDTGAPTDILPADEADGRDEMIICHDGDPTPDGELLGILDDILESWFSEFNTSRIVFIFDSCLSGGMTDLSYPGSGRVINMASTEEGLAYEYSKLENGQFTYYFVDEGMSQAFADKYDHDDDGIVAKKRNPGEGEDVTVEEAFDYANKKCKRQTPTISDDFDDDLLL